MPSINSLMGSGSASSIYGSRNANIISGLASGLDTESMIQGLVDSYQQKITKLTQDRTQLQWQQEAYQSVSNKLVEFYRNYMSFAYNSSNNLASSAFFSSAAKVITGGEFADKVTATGSSSSTILLKSVAQLAKAARYTTSGANALRDNSGIKVDGTHITATGEAMVDQTHTSKLEGTIELEFGGDKKPLSIDLGAMELVGENEDGTGPLDPEKLKNAINEQLKKQSLTIGENTYTGDQAVKVEVSADGAISFSENKAHIDGGNSVIVTGVSGKLSGALEAAPDGKGSSIKLKADVKDNPTETVNTAEALTGKKVTVTLDGKTKTFILGKDLKDGKFQSLDEVYNDLTKQMGEAFGGAVTVNFEGNKLSFQVKAGSSLSVTSEAGELLGLGEHGLTSYVNTSKSLGELLGDDMGGLTGGYEQKTTTAIKEVKADDGTVTYQDADGNKVDKDGYFLDEDGKRKQFYDLTINGKTVGSFSKDSTLQSVLNAVNNSDAGVGVQFSKTTNQFVFTAKETGEAGRIEIKDDTLGAKLFGAVDPDTADKAAYTKGQDAIFQVEVNGTTMNLARSSNSVEIDGMTLNFQGTFNVGNNAGGKITSDNITDDLFGEGEAVTFTAKADTDKVVDAVKKMVEDYNTLLTTVKDLYSSQPLRDSSGKGYEPLTDEDRKDMSDEAIKAYEEKAKTGLLFMDHDLSSLYNSLRSALTANSGLLKSVGLSTSYSNGTTTLKLDENALREALEKDPEAVKDAFTKRKDSGASEDGLMASMQKVVDRFAATTGATKGILIEKAGSKYSPSSALDNTMLDKLNEVDKQISKWQDKLAGQVDYYNNKFTQLEMLINQMNSQSSALAGFMGGGM